MGELYDTDLVTWSEQQSALLRRRAAGELVNEAEIDWPHVAEEIEGVGQSQVDAVESLLFQALLHILKARAWPLSRETSHWEAEARGFRAQARRKFRESMRAKLDVPGLYADALEALPYAIDGQSPVILPRDCDITLDGLLRREG